MEYNIEVRLGYPVGGKNVCAIGMYFQGNKMTGAKIQLSKICFTDSLPDNSGGGNNNSNAVSLEDAAFIVSLLIFSEKHYSEKEGAPKFITNRELFRRLLKNKNFKLNQKHSKCFLKKFGELQKIDVFDVNDLYKLKEIFKKICDDLKPTGNLSCEKIESYITENIILKYPGVTVENIIENEDFDRLLNYKHYLIAPLVTLILGAVLGSVLDTSLHALTIISANLFCPVSVISGYLLAKCHNSKGDIDPEIKVAASINSFLTFGQVIGLMVGGGIKGRLDLLIGGAGIFAMAFFGFIATKMKQKDVPPVVVVFR